MAALDSILWHSRTNNERDGVTGVLISSDRRFMRVLEGEPASVKRCFRRIVRESRHSDVQIVSCRETSERLVPGAGMFAVDASVAPRRLPDGRTERLRRIRWSAWNVIGANLRAGSLERWKLEQLRDSVARQTAEAQALRVELRGADADPELHVEVEELCGVLAEAAVEIARQLGARPAN